MYVLTYVLTYVPTYVLTYVLMYVLMHVLSSFSRILLWPFPYPPSPHRGFALHVSRRGWSR